MAIQDQGWGWPGNSRKAHYFESGELISLCRGWMFGGSREDNNHDSPDNCASCKRALAKKKAVDALMAARGEGI